MCSREDPSKRYKFPVYLDRDLGMGQQFQQLLQEAYDQDDDIDTRESVMEYFVDVCKQDLLEGLRMNRDEAEDEEGKESKASSQASFVGLSQRINELLKEK